MSAEMHYHDYLQLDKILNAQHPESNKRNLPAHDEMLFIVIHQAYELWFKQLHHELNSIIDIMKKPSLNDNSPELQTVVQRLNRMVVILRVLVHQIDILETMTPMDFLDFRDMLRPASGFQSWQFKEMEAKLGLKFEQRHGQEYYISVLREEHIGMIRKAEKEKSLLQLVNEWLERMPFLKEEAGEKYWSNYRGTYKNSLADQEKSNVDAFDKVFFEDSARVQEAVVSNNPHEAGGDIKISQQESSIPRVLSPAACRAALFIMIYRGYPILQLPFQLLNGLLDIDEQLSSWRYRHMNMVHRMIGARIGTGSSSGKDYLKSAADKHYIFREIAQLSSFLVERRKLPKLSGVIENKLGFASK